LLINNKNLTRDNLAKRQHVDNKACLFCEELESCHHLFFDCVVAKELWRRISSVVGRELGESLEYVGICWLSNKQFTSINIISSDALWALWKLRNVLCFQNTAWKSMGGLLMKIVILAQNWTILCPNGKKEELQCYVTNLTSLEKNEDAEISLVEGNFLCMKTWVSQPKDMEVVMRQEEISEERFW
jgi:hypothetical protein